MGVPGNANALLLRSAAAAGGYQVSRSLRFNSADSSYLTFNPTGTSTTFTASLWIKRSSISTTYKHFLFTSNTANGGLGCGLGWTNANNITVYNGNHNNTTAVYRDVAAWYHITLSVNAGTATLYVNGEQQVTGVTGFQLNGTAYLGTYITNAYYFDGYMAEIHLVDGLALTPSSFTETDVTTGQLIPKLYSGSYGTNGFKLTFADNSAATATTLGKDSAGSNNWTPNNFSVTAGAGNDSLKESPTSISGIDTGVGGEIAGNYCTWNPLNRTANTPITLKNGNLEVEGTGSASYWSPVNGTIGMSSGKWYWEVKGTGTLYCFIGIAAVLPDDGTAERWPGRTATSYGYYNGSGNKYNNNTSASYGASYDTTDVIGVAFDADNGKLWFAKNGTWQASGNPASGTNAAYSSIAAGTYFPCVSNFYTSAVQETNFGQRSWAYTAPSGFKALVDTNLTAPVIAKPSTVFQAVTYTGNSSYPRTISGLNFSPDLIWTKIRSQSYRHMVADVVRGTANSLTTNNTNAESLSDAYGWVSAFNSDGWSIQSGSVSGENFNQSGESYVAWAWDAGTSTVTNTQGSINSQVRANTSSGFSVLTATTPTSGSSFSVGHGLGVAPAFAIFKDRGYANSWGIYHKSITTTTGGELLFTTAAAQNYGWFPSAPTSTTFTLSVGGWGTGASIVGYLWTPVAGYSSAFSYTGNGSSDGPMVYLGFRPRFILQKRTDAAGSWLLLDTSRDPYNAAKNELFANSSIAEYTNTDEVDFLSNGFKVRCTFANLNASGGSFIGYAFAENPFQYARAR